MKIEGHVVEFKSTDQNYELEVTGQKSNTVRLLTRAEHVELAESLGFLTEIRIVHSEYPEVFAFVRKLTNVLLIGEMVGHALVVFSWKHEGEIKNET